MGNIIQTSGFEIQEGKVFQYLHAFPLIFDMSDTPSLLYRLDEDLKIGSTVSYRLVSGFQIVNWKGFVSSINGNSWTVELKQGPFSMFHAEHSIQMTDGLLECLLVFNMPFTFFKGLLDVALCFLVYKPLSPLLHK